MLQQSSFESSLSPRFIAKTIKRVPFLSNLVHFSSMPHVLSPFISFDISIDSTSEDWIMGNEFQENGAKAAPKESPLVIQDLWRVKPETSATSGTGTANPLILKQVILKQGDVAALDAAMRAPSTEAIDAKTLLSQKTWDDMKPTPAPEWPAPVNNIYQDGVLKLHQQGTQTFGLRFGRYNGPEQPADGSTGQSMFAYKESGEAKMGSLRGKALYLHYQYKF
jgi:hypothetical protein